MNTIISNNISENKKVQLDDPKGKVNRVINAVMSDCQLAKHVTDCEIKQYCLYAYTDTNRNTFGKAMQRVLDAHGEWFAFATFFGGQKPCICFDLTGEAYHLLHDTVAETSSGITEFFTKGKKYRCIKSVAGDFTKGKVYDQSSDPTQWYGYFRNDKDIHHVWPQPAQIDHNCKLYDMKPEDIDPRLYFEPVEE